MYKEFCQHLFLMFFQIFCNCLFYCNFFTNFICPANSIYFPTNLVFLYKQRISSPPVLVLWICCHAGPSAIECIFLCMKKVPDTFPGTSLSSSTGASSFFMLSTLFQAACPLTSHILPRPWSIRPHRSHLQSFH